MDMNVQDGLFIIIVVLIKNYVFDVNLYFNFIFEIIFIYLFKNELNIIYGLFIIEGNYLIYGGVLKIGRREQDRRFCYLVE